MGNAIASLTRGLVSVVLKSAVTSLAPVRSTVIGQVHEPFAGAWQRGSQVESLGPLTSFGAVFACVSRIANDIAKLELQFLERQVDGTWSPADAKQPNWVPLRKPNSYQNRIQFISYWLTCKLLHGNSYSLKERDWRGQVVRLYLLDPRRVTPMVTSEGDVYYSVAGDALVRQPHGITVPASEIIHDRGPTLWHPLVGVSPIMACAWSATQGLKIQQNSTTFFENMSRPSGMLTAPHTIDEVTAERLKAEWSNNYGGKNLGKVAIAGDGLTYQAMTMPADEAQLIEQLKWSVEDVARCFNMPLYKIGAGQMPTNNNVEALNTQYLGDCLQVHIEALEACLDDGLDVKPGFGVEFDIGGLLRMDQAAQMTMLGEGVKAAILSPNEARRKLNYAPVSGGYSPLAQQQNYSLSALARRDAKPDPFATEPATKSAIEREQKQKDAEAAAQMAHLDTLLRNDDLAPEVRQSLRAAMEALGASRVAAQQTRAALRDSGRGGA